MSRILPYLPAAGQTSALCRFTACEHRWLPDEAPEVRDGDILWLKESVRMHKQDASHVITVNPPIQTLCRQHSDPRHGLSKVARKIGPNHPNYVTLPPEAMPRWASRRLLKITDTRYEPIQNAPWRAAIWEGAPQPFFNEERYWQEALIRLWNRRHGAGAWERNDRVMVLGFTLYQLNVDDSIDEAAL